MVGSEAAITAFSITNEATRWLAGNIASFVTPRGQLLLDLPQRGLFNPTATKKYLAGIIPFAKIYPASSYFVLLAGYMQKVRILVNEVLLQIKHQQELSGTTALLLFLFSTSL